MTVVWEIVITVLVITAVAFVLGLILAFAGKKFAVEKDPRVEQIVSCLAGANCGACGFSGCEAYADAIVSEGAEPGRCPVAGADAAAKIAGIMGVDVPKPTVRMRAQVMCAGTHYAANFKYLYKGLADCYSVSKLGNGPKECAYGCIGLGSCVNACAFDAIQVENGVAFVAYDRCRACGMCVNACPQKLIELVPFDSQYWVSCHSKDTGAGVRSVCQVGCIRCGLCVRACPENAIRLEDGIAHIDYSLCTNCGACAEKCPRKIIRVGGSPLPRRSLSSEPAIASEGGTE